MLAKNKQMIERIQHWFDTELPQLAASVDLVGSHIEVFFNGTHGDTREMKWRKGGNDNCRAFRLAAAKWWKDELRASGLLKIGHMEISCIVAHNRNLKTAYSCDLLNKLPH